MGGPYPQLLRQRVGPAEGHESHGATALADPHTRLEEAVVGWGGEHLCQRCPPCQPRMRFLRETGTRGPSAHGLATVVTCAATYCQCPARFTKTSVKRYSP